MNTTIHGEIFDIFLPYTPVHLRTRENNILLKYGEDWTAVSTAGCDYVWTLIQGDFDELYIVSGIHLVNSLGYILTKKPHNGAFLQFRWTHQDPPLTPAGLARRTKQVLAEVESQSA